MKLIVESTFRTSADLQGFIEQAIELLKTTKLAFVRRISRHSWKFMELYERGLEGPLAEYALKKYKGHRSIPAFVNEELAKEMQAKLSKKRKL